MTGERAERFVVFNLRLLALSFALVGTLFIVAPDGVLDVITDLGDEIGDFTPAPETVEQFWLGLGFAYMVVIAGICLVVSLDVVRYRPLLLVLAAGKAASSLSTLGFYLFDADEEAVDEEVEEVGEDVGVALLLWTLAGRIGEPAAPS